jgi:hypothetical protein
MDKLLRVEVVGETDPVRVHTEVEASWASDVPRRVFDHRALAHATRRAIVSIVIVLKPGERQGDPVGEYAVTVLGTPVVTFAFRVMLTLGRRANAATFRSTLRR